jgi:predicted  nucleic acid-binding Zn-ribbon protein
VTAPPPSRELAAAREKAAGELAALVQLAELDAGLLDRENERRTPVDDVVVRERHRLGARLSPEIRVAYDHALRAGRRPAVARLAGNVCSGCHVRLHSTLEQKIRRRRGVGSCPHGLRLVYDPAWLHPADSR